MATICPAMVLCGGEAPQPLVEEFDTKHRIPRPPQDQQRMVAQPIEAGFDCSESRPRDIGGLHRNILHESMHCESLFPAAVRGTVSGAFCAGELRLVVPIARVPSTNASSPLTSNSPRGPRAGRMIHGKWTPSGSAKAAVFIATRLENRSGDRPATPNPMAPPQS